MSESSAPESPAPDRAGDDTTELSKEEYGSLSIEDDPEGTVDPAELADTADDSDHDQPDRGTQPSGG